jgi:LysR family transcriptional regulator, nod-box dependent transcriptional activator
MHFRQLDLNLLVALDALLTDRNITEASRRIYGRKMVPTPLAESLAAPVREILQQIRLALSTLPAFVAEHSRRRFTLMMSDYVSTVLMPEVLRRVEAEAPGVEFEILSNGVTSPSETLDRADVDLLIMPESFLSDEHPSQVLYGEGYACVVWSDNPLVGGTLTAEQYLSLGHVVLQYGRARTALVDEWFLTKLGVSRRTEVLAMHFNAVVQSIVGTRRIATTHRRLAEYYARYLPVRLLPPPFELPKLVEAVQWHKYFDQDPGNRWLRGVLVEAAKCLESH